MRLAVRLNAWPAGLEDEIEYETAGAVGMQSIQVKSAIDSSACTTCPYISLGAKAHGYSGPIVADASTQKVNTLSLERSLPYAKKRHPPRGPEHYVCSEERCKRRTAKRTATCHSLYSAIGGSVVPVAL